MLNVVGDDAYIVPNNLKKLHKYAVKNKHYLFVKER